MATVTFESQSEGRRILELENLRTVGDAQLGRVDWAVLVKAFEADRVTVWRGENDISPGLLRSGENTGLTRDLFTKGEIVPVKVYKQGECFLPVPEMIILLLLICYCSPAVFSH